MAHFTKEDREKFELLVDEETQKLNITQNTLADYGKLFSEEKQNEWKIKADAENELDGISKKETW